MPHPLAPNKMPSLTPTPVVGRKMYLRELYRKLQALLIQDGDHYLTWEEFRTALEGLGIPLTNKSGSSYLSVYIELIDDDDLEFRLRQDNGAVGIGLLYMASSLIRNPLASLKAVVESRLELMRRLGSIEHDADPVEEARVNALADTLSSTREKENQP